MKILIISLGLVFSSMLAAEVWEKPKYTPDEGHIQQEIEEQEERQESTETQDKKHQDVQDANSHPSFEMIDNETSEDEEASP